MVSLGTQPANRKSGFGHSSPTGARAQDLSRQRCTFIGSKRRTLWLFATIEVCSRLWAGSVLGRRSHRNTKAAINDVILRGRRQERITVSQTTVYDTCGSATAVALVGWVFRS